LLAEDRWPGFVYISERSYDGPITIDDAGRMAEREFNEAAVSATQQSLGEEGT
jgi:hypothetical protein